MTDALDVEEPVGREVDEEVKDHEGRGKEGDGGGRLVVGGGDGKGDGGDDCPEEAGGEGLEDENGRYEEAVGVLDIFMGLRRVLF